LSTWGVAGKFAALNTAGFDVGGTVCVGVVCTALPPLELHAAAASGTMTNVAVQDRMRMCPPSAAAGHCALDRLRLR
jgi:hypothetical protein